MNKDYILGKINTLLEEILDINLLPEEDLKSNGIDSLSIVTLIVSIEEEFNILFNDDDLDPSKLVSINSLVSLVEKYLWDCGNI